ncbi:hypothetical protein GCM10007416_33420 [Kroppenstedtia guangzhouensis]|uniref:Transposase n=1 Tax=Kroppenstedtia guangzhouensis TaxID=1274356 RepID=A0ABQ1H3H8_9BACL|nr:hypothetical protein [Kroppenstedtia guangzhouensis]GGA57503.1 hypothetical protein GCM10007416_33420 [Kroppenstedtia guangzhouensis]
MFGVSRSGYYAWLKRPQSERAKKQEELSQAIHRIFLRSYMLYGSQDHADFTIAGACGFSENGGPSHEGEEFALSYFFPILSCLLTLFFNSALKQIEDQVEEVKQQQRN